MKILQIRFFFILVATHFCSVAYTQLFDPLHPRYKKEKKLIDFTWNAPDVTELVANMFTIKDRPFEGIVFCGNWAPTTCGTSIASIFKNSLISPAGLGFGELSNINWPSNLTDNFLYSNVCGEDPNWFDNTVWNNITQNLRMLSLQVVAARAKGVFMDTEHYGGNVWKYNSTLYPSHTFDQVSAKVRQRGKEFIKALQYHKSDLKLLATGLWMFPAWDCYGNINNLSTSPYALLKAFSDGMLEGVTDRGLIIDGNEIAYSWTNTINWHSEGGAYNRVANAAGFIDPTLIPKKATNYQVGQACYYNLLINQGNDIINMKRLEHNVYESMFNADEYSWFYSETSLPYSWEEMASDEDEAIRIAKNKIRNSAPLEFTIKNDNTVTASSLVITSPNQYQNFNVGDVINLDVDGTNIAYLHYFISYNHDFVEVYPFPRSFTATEPGWYHVYATSNICEQFSQKIDFYVRRDSCDTVNSWHSENSRPFSKASGIGGKIITNVNNTTKKLKAPFTNSASIKIIPNPASTRINIEAENKIQKIEIWNNIGQNVTANTKQHSLTEKSVTINI